MINKSDEERFNELLEKYGLEHLKDAKGTTLKALKADLQLFFLHGIIFGMEQVQSGAEKFFSRLGLAGPK